MKKRVVILAGNHASHNPRAFKEAEALSAAGMDVDWLGGWYDEDLARRDRELTANRRWRFLPVVDWTRQDAVSRFRKMVQRGRRWVAGKAFDKVGWESGHQLSYSARELLRAGRRMSADLYIAHSEPGMWAARMLRREGKRVGVDMEDWFSDDLLPEARIHRPVRLLSELERDLLKYGSYRVCTSAAMSTALAAEYQCPPPEVVYNAFPWSDRANLDGLFKDRRDRQSPSIHWFSQTIGPGRGLEELLNALAYVEPKAEIHLRGHLTGGFREWLASKTPASWCGRIFTHALVSNDELLSRIAEHDIGFAGEMKYCRSRDLTVTNKILQYLLAGLAVVASDTAGQMEVAASAAGAVATYPSENVHALADSLNGFLSHPDRLADAKSKALQVAERTFCWEKNADIVVEQARRGLSHR